MPALMPSELPIIASARHHWTIMLRWPPKSLLIVMAASLVLAVLWPWPWVVVFAGEVGAYLFVRWQTWRAARIVLTQRRIIRSRGVPETTTTESSLRLDRISGAVLEQTVMGKLMNYATIELEAAGSHPDFRKLYRVDRPHQFYLQLRRTIFHDNGVPDADDEAVLFTTAPIPRLARRPFSRRWR